MEFMNIFFIVLSLSAIIYIYLSLKMNKRVHYILELVYLVILGFVFLIFLFPKVLTIIQETLGIASAINFIVYLSIFVAYFVIFILYKKTEEQRIEITKLVSEIALMKKNEKKKN